MAVGQLRNLDSIYWAHWAARSQLYEDYECWLKAAALEIARDIEAIWKSGSKASACQVIQHPRPSC